MMKLQITIYFMDGTIDNIKPKDKLIIRHNQHGIIFTEPNAFFPNENVNGEVKLFYPYTAIKKVDIRSYEEVHIT